MIAVQWEGRIGGTNARLGKARDGHMYATKPYEAFRDSLAWALTAERKGRTLTGPVAVRIEYTVDEARDLDSGIKATLDALQDSGIIADDLQVQRLEVTRLIHPRGKPDRVRLAVEALAPAGAMV